MAEKKQHENPFGDRRYLATTFEIRCGCGKAHIVRTKEREHKITCWEPGCNRGIRVVLGMGRNNYSVYMLEPGEQKGKKITPIAVMQ